MTYKQALEVLEISSLYPSEVEIKSSYRKLAKLYHPDLSASADSQKFLLINAAYLLLMNKQNYAILKNFNVEEEIALRYDEIDQAFQSLLSEIMILMEKSTNDFINSINSTLDKYKSNSDIRTFYSEYFEAKAKGYVEKIIFETNNKISRITKKYNTWIQLFIEKTLKNSKLNERKYWYKSRNFYKNIFIPWCFIICLSFYLELRGIISNSHIPYIAFAFFFVFLVYHLISISNLYEVENFKLDERKLQLTPAMIHIDLYNTEVPYLKFSVPQLTVASNAAGLGVGGGLLLGLAGLAVNGAIALWNKLTDIPFSTLKNKVYNQSTDNIKSINSMLNRGIPPQLTDIKNKLKNIVETNYTTLKSKTAKMLINPMNNRYVEQNKSK